MVTVWSLGHISFSLPFSHPLCTVRVPTLPRSQRSYDKTRLHLAHPFLALATLPPHPSALSLFCPRDSHLPLPQRTQMPWRLQPQVTFSGYRRFLGSRMVLPERAHDL